MSGLYFIMWPALAYYEASHIGQGSHFTSRWNQQYRQYLTTSCAIYYWNLTILLLSYCWYLYFICYLLQISHYFICYLLQISHYFICYLLLICYYLICYLLLIANYLICNLLLIVSCLICCLLMVTFCCLLSIIYYIYILSTADSRLFHSLFLTPTSSPFHFIWLDVSSLHMWPALAYYGISLIGQVSHFSFYIYPESTVQGMYGQWITWINTFFTVSTVIFL